MKKALFGVLSVISLAGLVACGAPVESVDETSEIPSGETQTEMAEEMPAEGDMAAATIEVSDSDLEVNIQEKLATLYPDTAFDVSSESGAVTIVGELPSEEEADYIAEWVTEIDGVTDVEVMAPEAETTP
jgi:osmotically-inducible protein OsmY